MIPRTDYGSEIVWPVLQEDVATYINNQLKLSQSEKALAALQQQIIGLKVLNFRHHSHVYITVDLYHLSCVSRFSFVLDRVINCLNDSLLTFQLYDR